MGKLLFWAVLIIGVLLVARILARHNARTPTGPARPRTTGPAAPAAVQSESMVRCAHCSIHLPRSEAVLVNGQTWCSTEHAKLGVRE